MKLIIENWNKFLKEARPGGPGGFMGMHVGSSEPEMPSVERAGEEGIELFNKIKERFEEIGWDWVVNSLVDEAGAPGTYRMEELVDIINKVLQVEAGTNIEDVLSGEFQG